MSFRTSLVGLAALLICLSASSFAGPVQNYALNNYPTAPSSNAPGYGFTYESLVQSPGDVGGIVYDTWWYDYYIENNSINRSITSWTWQAGGASGTVIPSSHPSAVNDGGFPLAPAASASLWDAEYCESNFEDEFPFAQVVSTISWDDGHTENVPIYVPSNVVPEPSSLIGLAFGVVPFLLRRRR